MNNKGFTLVELAIVLVIIGVILGGVIKGQELVTNARIKGLYREFQQVEFAHFSYFDRYNNYAGDRQGDTDGLIEDDVAAGTPGNEDDTYWSELRGDNFYNDGGTGATLPTHILGGTISVENGYYGLAGNVVCFSDIPGDQAVIFDTQFDDGDNGTGNIRADTAVAAAASATDYVDASTYVVCIDLD